MIIPILGVTFASTDLDEQFDEAVLANCVYTCIYIYIYICILSLSLHIYIYIYRYGGCAGIDTPSSQSKIRVFSDPTLGKSQRRRQTTYQTKVSGQPNPWKKSCEGKYCDGNWVQIAEQSPNHRHRNLKAFEERIQTRVSSCFVAEQCLYNFLGLGGQGGLETVEQMKTMFGHAVICTCAHGISECENSLRIPCRDDRQCT